MIPWSVPKDWAGERCFVLCSGPSLAGQLHVIPQLKGRFIGVKHGVLARLDADVLFMAGESTPTIERELIPQFTGTHIIVRGKWHDWFPPAVKRVSRTKDHSQLCELRDHVCGYDMGTSGIDLAYKFGATEIVLLGYDMTGGHFCPHPLQFPPQSHFDRHMSMLPQMAEDAKRKGIRIVNCSPISKVECFEKRPLSDYLP